ncbi:MAG: response regulator [Bacilli bacterium]|nr:response regulator [Bacilli bacterium]
MLICVFIDSILVTLEKGLVINQELLEIPQITQFVVGVLNKFDATTLIVLTSALFLYIYIITIKPNDKQFKKTLYATISMNIIFMILIFLLDVHLITNGEIISISGTALYPTYIGCGLNIIQSIFITLLNIKKITKKHIPLIITILMFILLILIFTFNPYITVISILLTFVNYVMYYTIENPDIQLLEEIHKSKEISDSANEEKTLFLYNMTQEIRNINKKIDDDADIILDSKDWEETYESARDIKSLTSKFNSMTNEILDISQISSSNIKVYNTKYNIKNLLKHIVNIYTDISKDKELKFITNIDHNIPEILYGDSIELKEILTIILNNSTKYTEKGYIEFNVNTIIKNDICRLIITIEDSGTGISSENINKIKIAKKSLSKANELITLMNGTMMISSDYGKGTKIKIILDQKMEIIENKEVSKYENIFNNVKILAIDDLESGLKIIDKLLKDTNIELDKAINGKDSINKIRINKYDIILLDEELSQISGIELIKKIKEIRNFNTPIILLTKDNSYEYNEEHLKLGFNDYILKPLKKDNLLAKINKYTKKGD